MTYYIVGHDRVHEDLVEWMHERGLRLRIGSIREVTMVDKSLIVMMWPGTRTRAEYLVQMEVRRVEFINAPDELRHGDDLRQWLTGTSIVYRHPAISMAQPIVRGLEVID